MDSLYYKSCPWGSHEKEVEDRGHLKPEFSTAHMMMSHIQNASRFLFPETVYRCVQDH